MEINTMQCFIKFYIINLNRLGLLSFIWHRKLSKVLYNYSRMKLTNERTDQGNGMESSQIEPTTYRNLAYDYSLYLKLVERKMD